MSLGAKPCLLVDDNFPFGIVSPIFIFSAMSSAYCGELFFLEGISDMRTNPEKDKTYEISKIRSYDERIFVLAFYVVFISFICYLLLSGFNSDFLKLFSIPIIIFMGLYMVVFYLTEGKYYENTIRCIKIKSLVIIIIIFLFTFLSNYDCVINDILDIFQLENIDINIQINNFIETFF